MQNLSCGGIAHVPQQVCACFIISYQTLTRNFVIVVVECQEKSCNPVKKIAVSALARHICSHEVLKTAKHTTG